MNDIKNLYLKSKEILDKIENIKTNSIFIYKNFLMFVDIDNKNIDKSFLYVETLDEFIKNLTNRDFTKIVEIDSLYDDPILISFIENKNLESSSQTISYILTNYKEVNREFCSSHTDDSGGKAFADYDLCMLVCTTGCFRKNI